MGADVRERQPRSFCFFVKSAAAKEKLKPALSAGNLDKTLQAPVTVIVAHDMAFYDQLPKLFPQADARSWFAGNPALIDATAFRNGSLQGAYLILAARALGWIAGRCRALTMPWSTKRFFAGTTWKSNFLINLGYGDSAKLHPRNPRLDFAESCRIE